MTVRPMTEVDLEVVAALRAELWPEASAEEHRAELPDWLADDGCCAFVAERDGAVIGFVEGRLRSHADGCGTTPVGYLEGWYVVPEGRRQGAGVALFRAFEAWARDRGCRELASDTWPGNGAGIAAHLRLGFEEVDRVVLFRKALEPDVVRPPSARPPLEWT